jgi:hypothetical protein
MPSWIILSWALVLGFVPEQADVVSKGNLTCVDAIRTDLTATVAELSVQADILRHFRLWGAMENYQYFSGFDSSSGGLGFYPYRADYTAGAAIYADGIELGIRHECDHPVVAGSTQGYYYSMETQIYIKISGTTR